MFQTNIFRETEGTHIYSSYKGWHLIHSHDFNGIHMKHQPLIQQRYKLV